MTSPHPTGPEAAGQPTPDASTLLLRARGIGKTYRRYRRPIDRLLERLPWCSSERHRARVVLRDIDLELHRGDSLGVIGGNGVGKSTLLRILSGVSLPTTGRLERRGSIQAFVDLGAGLHRAFTGAENIATLLSFEHRSRADARRLAGDIAAFAGIEEFVDEPVRTYSSGMIARLGFSIAAHASPDLLLIDEVLAVGDLQFQRRAYDRIWELKCRGTAIVFCSHSMHHIRRLCDRALWLQHGKIKLQGPSPQVTYGYAAFENRMRFGPRDLPKRHRQPIDACDHPHIVSTRLFDPRTNDTAAAFAAGDPVAIEVELRNSTPPVAMGIAVGVLAQDGTVCFCPMTGPDGIDINTPSAVVTLILKGLSLREGTFQVNVWLTDHTWAVILHEMPVVQPLRVRDANRGRGMFVHAHEWSVEPVAAADVDRPEPDHRSDPPADAEGRSHPPHHHRDGV